MLCKLALFAVLLDATLALTLTKGLSCNVTEINARGVCVPLLNCPELIPSIIRGGPRTRCGFEGKEEIICCPSSLLGSAETGGRPVEKPEAARPFESVSEPVVRPAQRPHKQRPQTTSAKPAYNKKGGSGPRISQQKCSEYAKAVFRVTPTIDPFSKKTTFSHSDYCALREVPESGTAYVAPNEFPHLAFIGTLLTERTIVWDCMGTLISEKFIVVSSSCVSRRSGAKAARLGAISLIGSTDDLLYNDIYIKGVITPKHTDNQGNFCHDIALLEFHEPVTFNERVRPACLPDSGSLDYHGFFVSFPTKSNGGLDQGKFTKQLLRQYESLQCLPARERVCVNGVVGGLYEYHSSRYCMYTVLGFSPSAVRCSPSNLIAFKKITPYLDWIEQKVWGH